MSQNKTIFNRCQAKFEFIFIPNLRVQPCYSVISLPFKKLIYSFIRYVTHHVFFFQSCSGRNIWSAICKRSANCISLHLSVVHFFVISVFVQVTFIKVCSFHPNLLDRRISSSINLLFDLYNGFISTNTLQVNLWVHYFLINLTNRFPKPFSTRARKQTNENQHAWNSDSIFPLAYSHFEYLLLTFSHFPFLLSFPAWFI